ncbi:MAG TPA: ATP-binding protein [Bacteroidales bacterium]|nr:ATP-binding protein [Bacteroidales bacterium]
MGAHDNGKLSGLKVNDKLLLQISNIRTDGNILPQPVMMVEKFSFEDGDVFIAEIQNPDGLYGKVSPANFPNVSDYRNPFIAEAMKILGYVNRFSRGIYRVQKKLVENGNLHQTLFPTNQTSLLPILS